MIYTTTNREGLYDFPDWERPTGSGSFEWESPMRKKLPDPTVPYVIPPKTPPRNFVDPKFSLYQTKFLPPSQRFYDQRERINEIRERLGKSYLPFFHPPEKLESEQCDAWRRCIETFKREHAHYAQPPHTPSTASRAPSRSLIAPSASAPTLSTNHTSSMPLSLKGYGFLDSSLNYKQNMKPLTADARTQTHPSGGFGPRGGGGAGVAAHLRGTTCLTRPHSHDPAPPENAYGHPQPLLPLDKRRRELEQWYKQEKVKEKKDWNNQLSKAKKMQQTLYVQRFAVQHQKQLELEVRRQMLRDAREEILKEGVGNNRSNINMSKIEATAARCFEQVAKREAEKLKAEERKVKRALYDLGVSEQECKKQEEQCMNSLMEAIGKLTKRRVRMEKTC